jgi:hypothetical protein
MNRNLLLATLLMSAAPLANATLIRIDMEFSVANPPSTWSGGGSIPAAVNGFFVVDTAASSAASYTSGSHSSGTAVTQFSIGSLGISDFGFSANGQTLWSGSSALGSFVGDLTGGNSYDAGLAFGGPDRRFSFPDTGLFGVYSYTDFLASTDPIADLLMRTTFSGPMSLRGDWGQLWSSNKSITKSVVPEPATFALLSIGLFGIWAARRRVTTSEPAANH